MLDCKYSILVIYKDNGSEMVRLLSFDPQKVKSSFEW